MERDEQNAVLERLEAIEKKLARIERSVLVRDPVSTILLGVLLGSILAAIVMAIIGWVFRLLG